MKNKSAVEKIAALYRKVGRDYISSSSEEMGFVCLTDVPHDGNWIAIIMQEVREIAPGAKFKVTPDSINHAVFCNITITCINQ